LLLPRNATRRLPPPLPPPSTTSPWSPHLRPPSAPTEPGNGIPTSHRCSPTPPPPPQPSGTPPPRPSAAAGRLLPWSSASALPQPQLSPHSPSSPPTEAPKPGHPIPAPPASRRRGTDPPPPPPFAAPPLQAIPAQPETAIRFAPTPSCSPPYGPPPPVTLLAGKGAAVPSSVPRPPRDHGLEGNKVPGG